MKLNHREKIIAIVVGGVVALYVVDQLFLTPMLDRLSRANRTIEDGRLAVNDADALRNNSVRAQRNWTSIAGDTLKRDASTAEQQLLNRIQDWAQSSNLSLTSLKPERNEKEKDFDRVTIRTSGNGSMSQIGRFLYALNESKVPVRVSDLQITSRKDGADDLAVQLGISTIYLQPEPPKNGQQAAGGAQ